VPPLACRAVEYVLPVVAEGSEVELIDNPDAVGVLFATVRVRVALADDAVPVIVTPKVKVPAAVGVPETLPLDCARDRPEGRLPEVMLHLSEGDVPVAARVAP